MDGLFAMQVSQPREDMASEIANYRLSNSSKMIMYIFINWSRMNILQIYVKVIINLPINIVPLIGQVYEKSQAISLTNII